MMVLFMALVFIAPLFITSLNSIADPNDVSIRYKTMIEGKGDSKIDLMPKRYNLRQFYKVLIEKPKYLNLFWNSVFIVVPVIIGQVLIACFSAYAFAKLKFPFRDKLFYIYIVLMMMPFQVTLVPNYIIADKLGILNSLLSIICPGIFSVFGVFLMRQAIKKIPDAYIEAAKVDGAGQLRIFFKIILPLVKNYIASLCVLLMIDYWNLVEQPMVFLSDNSKHPLSLFLAKATAADMNIAFASAVIYMIPVLLIYLIAENYFVEGIKNSGLKG